MDKQEKTKLFLKEMKDLFTQEDYFDTIEQTAQLKQRAEENLKQPKPAIIRFLIWLF